MYERILCILFDTSIKILSYLWGNQRILGYNAITLEKIFEPKPRLPLNTKNLF